MSTGSVVVSIGLISKNVRIANKNKKINPNAIVPTDFGLKVNTPKKISPKNDKYEIILFAITNEPLVKVQLEKNVANRNSISNIPVNKIVSLSPVLLNCFVK